MSNQDDFFRDQLIMTRLGIPKKFHGASIYNPELKETEVTRFLNGDFEQSGKNCALLIGAPGTGKTYGAIPYFLKKIPTIIEMGQVKNCQGIFITAYDLAEKLYRKEFSFLDRLRRVTALFIDELGSEPSGFKGGDFQAHFENMFSKRYENDLFTIVVSNFTKKQMQEHYGDRVMSRLSDYAQGYETTGPDMRKQERVS